MTDRPNAMEQQNWEVPSYETFNLANKSERYALVIPVINEGERIRAQLIRTRDADLPVDVIVVDGGSTDGSLEHAFLKEAGVRSLLVKTGPGKLSAQLRCAYSWCLQQGYEGIVTIDGNGKDNVEAVRSFAQKLDEGNDYVQGSRYMRGGVAENTPLERTLANRLVHAPMLSLFGRKWYTDTTNGFRAYSARYLLDERVAPFRDIFSVYSLLFYLTVRAGQLGYKVAHVPVRRSYPTQEAVPTKISNFQAKLALLGETLDIATGGGHPQHIVNKESYWPFACIGVALLFIAAAFYNILPFSSDGWAYFELSKTVFSDHFFQLNHFRNYSVEGPVSAAFPPLWPILIALFNEIVSLGAHGAFVLGFVVYGLFVAVSAKLGRIVTGRYYIGFAAALLPLIPKLMVFGELTSARSIPLQLLLFSILAWILLIYPKLRLWGAVAVGGLCALLILNRFDAAPIPIVLALFLGVYLKRFRDPAIILGTLLLVMSPWFVFSYGAFGKLFTSDNSYVAMSLSNTAFVTDWWPVPQAQMLDDPIAWLAKIIGNVPEFLLVVLGVLLNPKNLIAVFLAVAALFIYMLRISRKNEPIQQGLLKSYEISAWHKFVALSLFSAIVVQMSANLTTGYFDQRYFSIPLWMLFFIVSAYLVSYSKTDAQAHTIAILILILSLSFTVFGSPIRKTAKVAFSPPSHSAKLRQDQFAEINRCVGPASVRMLFLGNAAFAARTAIHTPHTTFFPPKNIFQVGDIDGELATKFLVHYDIGYLLNAGQYQPEDLQFAQLESIENCNLPIYRIR